MDTSTIEALSKAGLTGWPLAFVVIVGLIITFGFIASIFGSGWPWEGIIVRHYHCRCKGGKNCECHNEDEEDED